LFNEKFRVLCLYCDMTPESRNSGGRVRRPYNNAYRNVSVHTATNLQSTVIARNAITLLLKEVTSIRFDQNLPQGENWPTEVRRSEKWRLYFMWCSYSNL
jgi:hypothetical protein